MLVDSYLRPMPQFALIIPCIQTRRLFKFWIPKQRDPGSCFETRASAETSDLNHRQIKTSAHGAALQELPSFLRLGSLTDLITFRKRIYLEKCWRENPQRGSEYVCPVIYMYIYIVSIYWVYVLMHVSNSPSKVLGVWSHNCWVEIELTCAITSFAPWQAWLAG